MATRMMAGPEELFRVKVVRHLAVDNPKWTGWGCGHAEYVPSDETATTYFGPYTKRHAAVSMRGIVAGESAFLVSAEIESCSPSWKEVSE